jgi:hypothetical protein
MDRGLVTIYLALPDPIREVVGVLVIAAVVVALLEMVYFFSAVIGSLPDK